MPITQEQVVDALRNVIEPDLKKDLITLNMVEDIVVDGKNVSFTVVLTTPACPLKALIQSACVNAIVHFVDTEAKVTVNMTARTTSGRTPPPRSPRAPRARTRRRRPRRAASWRPSAART